MGEGNGLTSLSIECIIREDMLRTSLIGNNGIPLCLKEYSQHRYRGEALLRARQDLGRHCMYIDKSIT